MTRSAGTSSQRCRAADAQLAFAFLRISFPLPVSRPRRYPPCHRPGIGSALRRSRLGACCARFQLDPGAEALMPWAAGNRGHSPCSGLVLQPENRMASPYRRRISKRRGESVPPFPAWNTEKGLLGTGAEVRRP